MISDELTTTRLLVTITATIGLPLLLAIFGWVLTMERRLSRLEGKIDAICKGLTGLFKKIEKHTP